MKSAVIIIFILIVVGFFAFKRKKPPATIDPQKLSYSQLDITEHFGDNLRLKPDEWIATIPIKSNNQNPESVGLPSVGADESTVYAIGSKMSVLRGQITGLNDGVYCPICHIANIDIQKLHTPCPKCGRKLLQFGWD